MIRRTRRRQLLVLSGLVAVLSLACGGDVGDGAHGDDSGSEQAESVADGAWEEVGRDAEPGDPTAHVDENGPADEGPTDAAGEAGDVESGDATSGADGADAGADDESDDSGPGVDVGDSERDEGAPDIADATEGLIDRGDVAGDLGDAEGAGADAVDTGDEEGAGADAVDSGAEELQIYDAEAGGLEWDDAETGGVGATDAGGDAADLLADLPDAEFDGDTGGEDALRADAEDSNAAPDSADTEADGGDSTGDPGSIDASADVPDSDMAGEDALEDGDAEPSCPTVARSMRRGVWIWDETALTDDASRPGTLAFLRARGVTTLYVEAQSLVLEDPDTLQRILGWAQEACLSVELLFGHSRWALTPNHGEAIALTNAAVSFVSALSGPRPTALHFDVEPYTLDEWDADQESVSSQYLVLIETLRDIAHGGGLELVADIPFWFDGRSSSHEGAPRPLSELVQDRTDRVVLMDYRETAEAILSLAASELAYGDAVGRDVALGVETLCVEPEYITFCEEGAGAMESALDEVIATLAGRPSFAGVAIHEYRSWSGLEP